PPRTGESVTWFSGFHSIANSFAQFADPMMMLASFTTLFLIGWILADARLRTRSLFRSEEHTSELQSRFDLVCRLLLEKKNFLMCAVSLGFVQMFGYTGRVASRILFVSVMMRD